MTRKVRLVISPEQKLEYAQLMVESGYTNKQIQEISGASSSALGRWKQQYLREKSGIMPSRHQKALTPEQRRIQELEKQLRNAKRDNEILKKAAAFFIQDSQL